MIENDLKLIARSLEVISATSRSIARSLHNLEKGLKTGTATEPEETIAEALDPGYDPPRADVIPEIDDKGINYMAPANYQDIAMRKDGREVLKKYCAFRGIEIKAKKRPTKNIIQDLVIWDTENPYNPKAIPAISAAEGAEAMGDTPEQVAAQLNTEIQQTPPVHVPPAETPANESTPISDTNPAVHASHHTTEVMNISKALMQELSEPVTQVEAMEGTYTKKTVTPSTICGSLVKEKQLNQGDIIALMQKIIKACPTMEEGRKRMHDVLVNTCNVSLFSQVKEEQYPELHVALMQQLNSIGG
jgi:hypothetical protein